MRFILVYSALGFSQVLCDVTYILSSQVLILLAFYMVNVVCVLPIFWVKISCMCVPLIILFSNALLFCSWQSFLGTCIYRGISCLALNPNGFKVHKDFTKLIVGWVVGQTMSLLLVKAVVFMKTMQFWVTGTSIYSGSVARKRW